MKVDVPAVGCDAFVIFEFQSLSEKPLRRRKSESIFRRKHGRASEQAANRGECLTRLHRYGITPRSSSVSSSLIPFFARFRNQSAAVRCSPASSSETSI